MGCDDSRLRRALRFFVLHNTLNYVPLYQTNDEAKCGDTWTNQVFFRKAAEETNELQSKGFWKVEKKQTNNHKSVFLKNIFHENDDLTVQHQSLG